MWRRVVAVVHAHDDSQEARDLGAKAHDLSKWAPAAPRGEKRRCGARRGLALNFLESAQGL